MPSTSKKQHNFMAAVANNPKFAKKADVPQSVGEDFVAADKVKASRARPDLQGINKPKTDHGSMSLFNKGGAMKDMKQDKAMVKKAVGMHDKQMHGGKKTDMGALKKGGMRTKTGMMLGLGETKEEVVQSMKDLVNVGCDVLTLGQYLQPTKKHLAVQRFVHPDEFAELREIGYEIGFDYVESGPLVRSSYHSEKHVIKGWGKNKWLSEKSA